MSPPSSSAAGGAAGAAIAVVRLARATLIWPFRASPRARCRRSGASRRPRRPQPREPLLPEPRREPPQPEPPRREPPQPEPPRQERVPSPVLPSERASSAATGSVPASSASALSELCPSANANRSTNETNEASPRLVRRRPCREFVLVPILHPPTGVCATSLPYGPGPRPTAYTVVLLPRKVTPPSGGHIGRTASPLLADGVVRSEERERGGSSLLRETETLSACGRIGESQIDRARRLVPGSRLL